MREICPQHINSSHNGWVLLFLDHAVSPVSPFIKSNQIEAPTGSAITNGDSYSNEQWTSPLDLSTSLRRI